MMFSTIPPGGTDSPGRLPPPPGAGIFRFLRDYPRSLSSHLEPWSFSILDHRRRRSVAFLERDGQSWACFLVTFLGQDHRWHGYFSFRPKDGEMEEDEVRTADIFSEGSEAEIDQKARGLGRPLLSGLLASALHLQEQEDGGSPKLRRWFRTMLAENSQGLAPEWPWGEIGAEADLDMGKLRSLYASYRLDQVCHFIALVQPEDFEEAVAGILEGEAMDFGSKDVLQFAMMVVEYIEALLPLPPFEIWAEDFLGSQRDYALYTHTLHREGRLP